MKLKIGGKIIIAITAILLAISIYTVVFGKLLPYSPIAIGFNKHETAHTIVYAENGGNFRDFEKIDKLLGPVEEFHRMKFKHKPKIYIFSDKSDYYRRTFSRARFYSYPNGNLVVAPWAVAEADSGLISLDIYLTHELSHTILYQNMGVLAAYHFPQWLMEGLAVYSSNQMGTSKYPSKERTYQAIRDGNFLPPEYFKTDKEDKVKLDIENRATFIYSEFGCIVDYMIQKYGKDTFITYLQLLMDNENFKTAFSKIYGTELDTVLSDFRNQVAQSQ
jgi:hypothetical protein